MSSGKAFQTLGPVTVRAPVLPTVESLDV